MKKLLLKFKKGLHHFGVMFIVVGGVLFLNEKNIYVIFLLAGMVMYLISSYLNTTFLKIKNYNWELAFPELALGGENANADSSTLYIRGKKLFLTKLFLISKSLLILTIVSKFMIVDVSGNQFSFVQEIIPFISYTSGVIISVVYLLRMFTRIDEKPNWGLVFPELLEKKQ